MAGQGCHAINGTSHGDRPPPHHLRHRGARPALGCRRTAGRYPVQSGGAAADRRPDPQHRRQPSYRQWPHRGAPSTPPCGTRLRLAAHGLRRDRRKRHFRRCGTGRSAVRRRPDNWMRSPASMRWSVKASAAASRSTSVPARITASRPRCGVGVSPASPLPTCRPSTARWRCVGSRRRATARQEPPLAQAPHGAAPLPRRSRPRLRRAPRPRNRTRSRRPLAAGIAGARHDAPPRL